MANKAAEGMHKKDIDGRKLEVINEKPVTVTEAPFLETRIAWSPADWMWPVNAEIKFQPWTKLETVRVTHMLNFESKLTI